MNLNVGWTLLSAALDFEFPRTRERSPRAGSRSPKGVLENTQDASPGLSATQVQAPHGPLSDLSRLFWELHCSAEALRHSEASFFAFLAIWNYAPRVSSTRPVVISTRRLFRRRIRCCRA
jgi:hypothetical protein